MDKPVLYNPFNPFVNNYPGEIDKLSLRQRLSVALLNDDKATFMSLIKDPGFGASLALITVDVIFRYDPLEIAKAVLRGETMGLIDTEGVMKDGVTPLHLAAIRKAPKLTKYYLENGGIVDAVCDYKRLKLKRVTAIDLSAHFIETDQTNTLFDMLWWLCFNERAHIETIRLFVIQRGQHKWARTAFLNYAQNGEIRKLAGLFLAAPELCLPLLRKLTRKLNFLGHKKRTVNQLSLLYDVLASVGHKLAAYIRLEEFAGEFCNNEEEIEPTMLEIESFIREAAYKNYRVYNRKFYDYYLSFFEGEEQSFDDDGKRMDSAKEWNMLTPLLSGNDIYHFLPYMLQKRRGFSRRKIFRLIPTLNDQNPGRASILTRAMKASVLHNRKSVSINELEPVEGETR